MPSLTRFDGELELDNRAGGDPVPIFGDIGYSVIRAPTVRCWHCGGCWMLNPLRTRERAHCRTCDRYICDGCKEVTLQPGYVHRTIDDLTEMIQSGNWKIVGGTCVNPILVPTGVSHG